MSLYDGNGNEIEVGGETLNVSNLGHLTSSTSFFSNQEKTATGTGTTNVLKLETIAIPNTVLGNKEYYVAALVKSSKPATLMIFMGGSIIDALINADPYGDGSQGASSYASMHRAQSVYEIDAEADVWYYLYGNKEWTTSTSGASRGITVAAKYDSSATQNGAVLTAVNGVLINLTDEIGENAPDQLTVRRALSECTNYYFEGTIDLYAAKAIYTFSESRNNPNSFGEAYVEVTDDKNVRLGGGVNAEWPNWDKVQYSYGQNKLYTPIETDFHGKVFTDSQFTAVPLWSHWGRKANTVGAGDWGGHVFHGWNDAQTYRLTLMASGGMTSPDSGFKPREDEFCLHVFSPTGAYNNPIDLTDSEAQNRITQDNEDVFSGSAYYGRLRIGADRTDEGFLFRAKSLVCYGRVDLNGNKLILGNQAANVPANATSSGKAGQIAYDSNYVYICVADNTWKRAALETW